MIRPGRPRPPLTPADQRELANQLIQDLAGLVTCRRLSLLGPNEADEPAFRQALVTGRPVFDFERRLVFLPLAGEDRPGRPAEVEAVAVLEGAAELEELARHGSWLARLARLGLDKFNLVQAHHRDQLTGLWLREKLLSELAGRLLALHRQARPSRPRLEAGPGREQVGGVSLVLVRLLSAQAILDRFGGYFFRLVIQRLAGEILQAGGQESGAGRLSEAVLGWLIPTPDPEVAAKRAKAWLARLGPQASPDHRRLDLELAGGVAAWPLDLEALDRDVSFEEALSLARELEDKAGRALAQAARLGPGEVLTLAEVRRRCGRVVESLPLDRVVIDLGQAVGVGEGASFLVLPQGGGEDQPFKAHLTVLAATQEQATAEVAALSDPTRPVLVGDRLRLAQGQGRLDLAAAHKKTIRLGGRQVEVGTDPATGLPSALALPDLAQALAEETPGFILFLVRAVGLIQRRALVGQKETDLLLAHLAELGQELLAPAATARAGVDLLAFFVAGDDHGQGLELGRRLVERAQSDLEQDLRVGLAVHPFLGASPAEALARAAKALDHASFPTAEPVVLFNAVSLNLSGDRAYGRGDLGGAVAEYEKALQVDSDNVNILNSLGACYGHLDRLEEAAGLFQRAAALAPAEFMAWYNLGQVKRRQGHAEAAEAALLKAVEVSPGEFAPLFALGQHHLTEGRPGRAVDWFQRAAAADATNPTLPRWLGEALARAGRPAEALKTFKAAVKANPGDATALSWLGRLYLDKARDQEVALSLTRQAANLEPDNGLHQAWLGLALLANGRPEEALGRFQAAVSLGERRGEVLLGLGRALAALGRPAEAEAALVEAADLDPADPVLLAELDRLRQAPARPAEEESRHES